MHRNSSISNPVAGGNNTSKKTAIDSIVENTQGLIRKDLLLENDS